MKIHALVLTEKELWFLETVLARFFDPNSENIRAKITNIRQMLESPVRSKHDDSLPRVGAFP